MIIKIWEQLLQRWPVLQHWPLFITAIVLTVLLWRNPFSQRTLIPNFEPFPDAFHYVVPPQCFLQGKGWRLCRDGVEGITPAVPPLYGAILLPSLALGNDPRAFYFSNVVLAFLSLVLMYAISQKISKSTLASFLVTFIFITTYHVYWLPSLAMAENLILPLFLSTVWFLLDNKKTTGHLATIGILAGLQYGTKFAGLPLMVGIVGMVGLQILIEHVRSKKIVFKTLALQLLAVSVPALLLFLSLGGWRTVASVVNPQNLIAAFTTQITSPEPSEGTSSTSAIVEDEDGDWFETAYFSKNIVTYLGVLRGQPSKFLWDSRPLFTPWIAVLAGVGLLYGIYQNRWRWLTLTLVVTSALQLTMLSFFYTTDARYIYTILPVALIGLTLFITGTFELSQRQQKYLKKETIFIGLAAIFALYSGLNFSQLKLQALLNLKSAETPWWQVAVVELNGFFEDNPDLHKDKQPIVISPISPFLVDFYSNKQYSLLPLNPIQDFSGNKKQVWGENNYDDFIALYHQKLDEGYPVYVAEYGLGNDSGMRAAYDTLEQNFTLTKVQSGCHDLCDVFKVSSKSAELNKN
jgi:hypothetical protein